MCNNVVIVKYNNFRSLRKKPSFHFQRFQRSYLCILLEEYNNDNRHKIIGDVNYYCHISVFYFFLIGRDTRMSCHYQNIRTV